MDTLGIQLIAGMMFAAAAAIVAAIIIEMTEADWRRQRLITLYEMISLEKELHDESIRQLNELKRRNIKAAQEAQRVIREREK